MIMMDVMLPGSHCIKGAECECSYHAVNDSHQRYLKPGWYDPALIELAASRTGRSVVLQRAGEASFRVRLRSPGAVQSQAIPTASHPAAVLHILRNTGGCRLVRCPASGFPEVLR